MMILQKFIHQVKLTFIYLKIIFLILQIFNIFAVMKTTYKIQEVNTKTTVIHEYWDDLLIFTYIVYSSYRGGNIEEFLKENYLTRQPDFENLNEFHRRTFILESY